MSLSTDRVTTTPYNTTAVLTGSASPAVPQGYFLTLYDSSGTRVAACNPGSSTCTASSSPALNATVTYTAYVALTMPATGPPTGDVHSSGTVSVTRIGYQGEVSLGTNRETTTPYDTSATLTASVPSSDPVPAGYFLSIYDQTGARRTYCTAGQNTCAVTVSPALNSTEGFTAYVATTAPVSGIPTGDMHSSGTVSVNRIGYLGTVSLVTNRATTTPYNTSATLTASAPTSDPVPSGYFLSIYDQDNARLTYCNTGYNSCSVTVSPALGTAVTYTAYVAKTVPTTGPPTGDRQSSAGVSVNRIGYLGTVTLVTNRNPTTPYNTSATLTASVPSSDPVPAGYYLSIYDGSGSGSRLNYCNPGYNTCSVTVSPALGATGDYVAYVAKTVPTTGPPTGDKAYSANVSVTRVGYQGTVTLVTDRQWTSTTNPSAALTASVPEVLPAGYWLAIYDQSGVRRAFCGQTQPNCSVSVSPAANAVETFTAFVAKDTPYTGPPTGDVHSSGSVSVHRRPPAVPTPQTYGATSSGECECPTTLAASTPTTVSVADPVNTATGAFWEQVTDATLPGAGTTFRFTRSYTSLDTTTGRLGPGWTDPYQAALTIPSPTSNITLRSEDGAQAVFTRNPDATYSPPPGVRSQLTSIVGGYRVATPNGHTVTFDSTGRLTGMADPHGQGLTFTWASGKMTAVTDAAGRAVALAYHPTSGLLTSITLPDNRHVDYTYTSGRLTGVSDLGGQDWSYGYDSAGRLTTMTDPRGHDLATNVYDGTSGRVTSQTDALGNTTTIAWNAGSQTATVTNPDTGVWTYAYEGNVLAAVTNPLGHSTRYFYDSALNRIGVSAPSGATTTFTYDARGNRLTAKAPAPLGHVTTWTYDGDNNVTSVTDPLGHVTTLDYNTVGDLTEQTTPEGAVTTWSYNADGTPAWVTDPRGNATGATPADYRTVYGYDADANLTSVTTPEGRQSTFGYDGSGRLTSAIDPRGNATGATPADYMTTTTWTDRDQVHEVTDALGNISTRTYDASGNLASTTDPLTNVTTFGYDHANRLATVTDPLTSVTAYERDWAGHVTAVVDPDGNRTTTTYDKLGRVKTSVSPRGNATGATAADFTTTYGYDTDGNPTTVAHPLPTGTATATTAYDVLGRPTAVTDPGGKTTTLAYDAAGRTTTVTDPLGNDTITGYDDDGHVLTVTDPNENTTTYTYDPAGQLLTRTDPLTRTTAWTHDHDGLPATLTQPGSLVTTYSHDDAGNLTDVDYSDTATPDVAYSYDRAGRRSGMTDATGTSTYAYDDNGRPTAVTDGHGDTVGYGYDDAGRLTDLDYPGTGSVATYTYTDAGRLATLTDWGARETAFTYDRDGQLTDIDYPNGVATDQTYDIAGRLTAATTAKTTTTVLDLDYAYNTRGLLTDTETVLAAVTSSSDYGWDDAARLDTGTDGDYTFDPADQLTRQAATTASYDDAGQLTATTTGTADTDYSYDTRGNRTATTPDTGTATAYAYTQDNQLATYQRGSTDIAYTYDGDGLRTDTTTGTAPSTTTEEFTWDTTGALPLLLQDGDHTYLYGPAATPIAQIDNTSGNIEYLHHDLNGSTRALTNNTGQTVATRTYNPYGATTATTGTTTSRFGYAGEYTEAATGLIYLRARHYDPTTGQFLTRDPLQDQTGSPYAYTGGNPIQFTDPAGLDWLDDVGSWTAGFEDALTLGGTKQIRRAINYGLNGETDDMVDHCSIFYKWGGRGGIIASFVPMAGGLRWAGGVLKRMPGVKSLFSATGARAALPAAKGVNEGGALVRYDAEVASRNLLGQIGSGYAVTPGGRTVSAHAAKRIVYGAPGRSPTTLNRVDDILDNPTRMVLRPNGSVRVYQGKDWVAISGTGPVHIVTVMIR